jgi:hypothetical protein
VEVRFVDVVGDEAIFGLSLGFLRGEIPLEERSDWIVSQE